ncbi:hypothetical protein [Jiangella muralis]|uniref:hypothetical protein n=1 Tax=Jiangella muralis TaxID=702383 RepID=UPI00069D8FF4|nr:hypothetical protein [Jiangella muralis]
MTDDDGTTMRVTIVDVHRDVGALASNVAGLQVTVEKWIAANDQRIARLISENVDTEGRLRHIEGTYVTVEQLAAFRAELQRQRDEQAARRPSWVSAALTAAALLLSVVVAVATVAAALRG